ncbi:MAG: hypothetical protein RIC14_02520 [Filomicrobium sp.]
MVSGRRTLKEIERSIRDLRSREQRLQKEVEDTTRTHIALLEQRATALRELAEVRTRDAVSDGIIDEADRLQVRVESLLKARQATIDTLKLREQEANEQRDALTENAERLVNEIEEKEALLDRVAQQARTALEADDSFSALKKSRDEAKSVHEQARLKTTQAEEDRQQKGEAYENDPLFMYLWNRKYGSKTYRPFWFIRSADDWVARKVGYSEARANYAILNEIPDRLQEHVALLAEDLEQRETQIEEAVAARVNDLAGMDLIGALSDVRDRQSENNQSLEASAVEIEEITGQLNRYAEGLDSAFEKAVTLSVEFLEHESYQELIKEARKTPDPADNRIVSRIGEIERKTTDAERNLDRRRKELNKINGKRKELLDVASRFRRNYYDDPGSEFELDDIAEVVLRELINGAITAADYWARSQRRHHWKSRPADGFRRSQGFPPFGGGRRRGKRSRGRFRTGGGF